MATKQRGFTIVELIIVIVVIGILATITIVAYNGVQGRARNVSVSSSALDWSDSLDIYQTLAKALPEKDGSDTYAICLAFEKDLPAQDGMDAGACTGYLLNGQNVFPGLASYQADDAMLAEIASKVDIPQTPPLTQKIDLGSGLVFWQRAPTLEKYCTTYQSGACMHIYAYRLTYGLENDAACVHDFTKVTTTLAPGVQHTMCYRDLQE